jgi:hypothetical protein
VSETKPNGRARDVAGTAMRWIAGGSGVGLTLYVLEMLRGEGLVEVLKSWGPPFGLGAVGILTFGMIFHVNLRSGIEAVKEHAEAMTGVKNAFERMAGKDDTRDIAMQAAVGRIARSQERMFEVLGDLGVKLDEHLEKSVKKAGEYEHRLDEVEKKIP